MLGKLGKDRSALLYHVTKELLSALSWPKIRITARTGLRLPPQYCEPLMEGAIMPKVDVAGNVTLFAQNKGFFCGEAIAEMARNGYPDPSNRFYYTQDDLRNNIVAHDSTAIGDLNQWNTDPQGLCDCLQSLSAEPVNWVEFPTIRRDEAQMFLQQSIQSTQFPVGVLIRAGEHWVLVVGYETEVDATGTEKLKFIHFYDPEPVGIGADRTIRATTWSGSRYFVRVKTSGTWEGKFVVVGQQPH
jgi:hypothetical protein